MTEIDYIVVGQGIAGTVLDRKLTIAGYTVLVIDQGHKTASSLVAAGLINPITGRKYVKSWRIEDFLPEARRTYKELSEYLDRHIYDDVTIHRALYSIKDENIWHGRKEDPLAAQYICESADTSAYEDKINHVLSYGSLRDGMQVHLPALITAYRTRLQTSNRLYAEQFDRTHLTVHEDHVLYKDVKARAVIFAEGHHGKDNPLWKDLTFAPVKGEVLIVDIAGRPFKDVLRHKLFITPLPSGYYWVGSGYEWEYDNLLPTVVGRAALEQQLRDILSVPFTVVDHIAGVRPAVKGRKPFLGPHPDQAHTYIFNGMGTKGTSLAPYWADHFVGYLEGRYPLDPDVDIRLKLENHN